MGNVNYIQAEETEKLELIKLIAEIYNGETIKIMPSKFWKEQNPSLVRLFMHYLAYYTIPTIELQEFLKEEIGDKTAIEIGCGHGELARALNIPATDSRLQENPNVKVFYAMTKQPIIKYPDFVQKYDAIDAVNHFNPDVAFGCFITHKYNGVTGNPYGVEERDLIGSLKKYIHVGDTDIHSHKPLHKIKHKTINPDWLVSRGKKPFIKIWNNE